MREKHAPWCARFMSCTYMAPGGPNTSAAERISWLMQRYDEGRKACEMVVTERNALRTENVGLREALDHEQRAMGFLIAAMQMTGDTRSLPEIVEWAHAATARDVLDTLDRDIGRA